MTTRPPSVSTALEKLPPHDMLILGRHLELLEDERDALRILVERARDALATALDARTLDRLELARVLAPLAGVLAP